MGFVPVSIVDACNYKSLCVANKRLTHVKVKRSKNARSRKNVVRENSGILEQEVSSGKSCPVQQRLQLLTRTTYRGIKQAENSVAINGYNKIPHARCEIVVCFGIRSRSGL